MISWDCSVVGSFNNRRRYNNIQKPAKSPHFRQKVPVLTSTLRIRLAVEILLLTSECLQRTYIGFWRPKCLIGLNHSTDKNVVKDAQKLQTGHTLYVHVYRSPTHTIIQHNMVSIFERRLLLYSRLIIAEKIQPRQHSYMV